MKKTFLFYAGCQLFGWLLMCLSDFCEESGNGNFLLFLSYFILPLLISVFYAVYCKNVNLLEKDWKSKVLDKLLWLGIGLLFAVPICTCLEKGVWFIAQTIGDLDGLEYFIFAFLFNIGSLIWFVIFDVFYFFMNRKKKKM